MCLMVIEEMWFNNILPASTHIWLHKATEQLYILMLTTAADVGVEGWVLGRCVKRIFRLKKVPKMVSRGYFKNVVLLLNAKCVEI